jgi:predicted aspartyl protease
MIRGRVDGLIEAHTTIRLRGPTGVQVVIDAMIDTGFSSALSLDSTTIAALGLVRSLGGVASMADGSSCRFNTYFAEVDWDGAWQTVVVWQLGNEPLIGMGLLLGYALMIEVKPAGSVVIDKLP